MPFRVPAKDVQRQGLAGSHISSASANENHRGPGWGMTCLIHPARPRRAGTAQTPRVHSLHCLLSPTLPLPGLEPIALLKICSQGTQAQVYMQELDHLFLSQRFSVPQGPHLFNRPDGENKSLWE